MPTPEYHLRCTQNNCIANGVYDFRFEKPEEFTFVSGQFVLFDFPLVEDLSNVQTRAFSIASAPEEDELIFITKLIDGGRASRWIDEKLQAGDTVRTQGPFGRFVLNDANPKDYLFVCTSTGVAPFRAQILSALRNGDTRRMDLLFGARTEEDLFWQEELNALAAQYENLHVHYALTQPGDNWSGASGRVQTLMPDIAGVLADKQIYVCGNPDMTNDVKRLCLEEWGIEKGDLHVEGYI